MVSPSPRQVLRGYRRGAGDQTTKLTHDQVWRATLTPDGPGTLHLWWRGDDPAVQAEAWGPGGPWLIARVPALTGELDPGHRFTDAHPVIMSVDGQVSSLDTITKRAITIQKLGGIRITASL